MEYNSIKIMEGALMKTKKGKIIVWVLFIIYILLLVKVILFKYPIAMVRAILKDIKVWSLSFRISHSNFIPLKSIFQFILQNENMRISLENILGNIMAFVPFGFLLPLLTDGANKFKSIIISSFILSLVFEIIQLLTGLGEFDVDDVLLNVLGASLGYILYRIFTSFTNKYL